MNILDLRKGVYQRSYQIFSCNPTWEFFVCQFTRIIISRESIAPYIYTNIIGRTFKFLPFLLWRSQLSFGKQWIYQENILWVYATLDTVEPPFQFITKVVWFYMNNIMIYVRNKIISMYNPSLHHWCVYFLRWNDLCSFHSVTVETTNTQKREYFINIFIHFISLNVQKTVCIATVLTVSLVQDWHTLVQYVWTHRF